MDVGNMLDWEYLRLCCLPACQSLHKSRGIAVINSTDPLCVITWSCCKPSATATVATVPWVCARISHTASTAVRLSAFLFLCFRNMFYICHGTYYRPFTRRDNPEMHKIGTETARNAPFVLQRGRLGAFSGWWSQITGVQFLGIRQSPTTGSGWMRIYKRWQSWQIICGRLYKRSWAPKSLVWGYYSKIGLKSKKLDLMAQDALSNPLFLWGAVNRAGDCAVLGASERWPHFIFVFCKMILTSVQVCFVS